MKSLAKLAANKVPAWGDLMKMVISMSILGCVKI